MEAYLGTTTHMEGVALFIKITKASLASVTHIYNSSYLRGWDQKDYGFRPASGEAESLRDPISMEKS
jgi:hypothetical protein